MKTTLLIIVTTFIFSLSINTSVAQVSDEELTPVKTSTGYQVKEEILHKAKSVNMLYVTNKYGDIIVDGWDKDSVKIVYEINVGSFVEGEATELLDQISVRKYFIGKSLNIKTVFEEDFHSSYTFSINYHIHVPYNLKTNITTGFGNIYLTNMTGDASVNAEYGKLFVTTNTVISDRISLDLDLSFIEGEIQDAVKTNVNLNNCKININRTDKFSGMTKYSVVSADSILSLDVKTDVDRYTVNYCDSVNLTGEKTFFTVLKLTSSGHFEINTGGLSIGAGKSLTSLDIANNKANTEIIVPGNLGYLLHGEVTRGVLTHYDQRNLQLIRDGETISFSGEFGSDSKANIIIFNTSSNLTIKK